MIEHTVEVVFEGIDMDDDDHIEALVRDTDLLLVDKVSTSQTGLVAVITSDHNARYVTAQFIEKVLKAVPTATLVKIVDPE